MAAKGKNQVVTIGYMLVGMWVAYWSGMITHQLADENKPPIGNITVYKIGVDLNGNTASQCLEYHGPGSVDENGEVDKSARNE